MKPVSAFSSFRRNENRVYSFASILCRGNFNECNVFTIAYIGQRNLPGSTGRSFMYTRNFPLVLGPEIVRCPSTWYESSGIAEVTHPFPTPVRPKHRQHLIYSMRMETATKPTGSGVLNRYLYICTCTMNYTTKKTPTRTPRSGSRGDNGLWGHIGAPHGRPSCGTASDFMEVSGMRACNQNLWQNCLARISLLACHPWRRLRWGWVTACWS